MRFPVSFCGIAYTIRYRSLGIFDKLFATFLYLHTAKLIRADLDLTLEANALIALVDGIGTGVVICPEQFSATQQQYLVRRHINSLLASS